MKITLLQQDISWGKPEENVCAAEQAMDARPGADLYVLPEMFSTGFCTEPEGLAEPADSDTLRWMRRYAQAHGCAVAGSIAVLDRGKYCNRFHFVFPDGTYRTYDKRHLFTYGGEDKHFTAGRERVIVEYGGVRFLLLICYDLRFPVWARNRKDYDAILYVANWPTPRVEAWLALLKARAIENQCYVAGVNRVGTDPSCEYCGGTLWIDPYGNTVAACERGMVDAVTVELDMGCLTDFRRKFPVLEDGDGFKLEL